ncbi:MAG: polysaccharide deacetylase family protein [Nitrosopumilaceae archaeon]
MKFKTKQNIAVISTPIVSILALFFIIQSIIPVFGEDLSQVEIDIKNSNGDRTAASNVVFKVYQYAKDTLYTELKPKSDYPYFVASLPVDHKYRLDGFVNGMFAGSSIINIKNNHEQIDFILPKSSGMNLQILYNDNYTPIVGATVIIKNHDGKILRKDFSDKDGSTLSFSSLPTIREGDFYQIEVSIAENITHTYSPIKLLPGFTKDIQITTPWPTMVNSLITLYAYNMDLKPIASDNGKYVAELYDKENNQVARSEFNTHSEAYFSNLHVGNYRLLVKDIDANHFTYFVNKTVSILGDTNEIEVIAEQFLESNLETDNLEPDSLEENISEITSCNCVAFRLDDIQDYWINDVQIEIMEIFNERDVPLTIGIIGSEIGEDIQIVSYINQSISSNLLEIANHGWKHEDFTEYDKETQSQLIKNTNEQLQNIFGVTPTVFIPPYNEYNNDTISAMNENDITHFSSSTIIANPPYPMIDAQLYSFPTGASTGELYLENSLFTGINHKLTLSQIQKSISQYGFAVVMMHPQEFSVIEGEEHLNEINWNQIRELELLLDRLKIEGLDIVPISKIDFDLDDTPKLPPWVQQISQWWSEGKISDDEYVSGIKFYQDNGIISI